MTTREPCPCILIVDDDASIREGLAIALKDTYVVHTAPTGEEACTILRRYPVAAIILDAVLRHEQGLDLIPGFRKISQAPILILTGFGTEELAVRSFRGGASDYLKKPVDLHELRTTVARVVRQAGAPSDPVARACRLLEEHPERPHTTGSLASEVALSERHLRRQFRAVYGKTPPRYLTEVRLQRAAELLRATPLGIEQIAHAVGYPRVATFNSLFKRAYGATPSEYRTRPGPRPGQEAQVPGASAG